MRLDKRHYDATKIKLVNHSSWKKDDKYWVECDKCKTWLWEEDYFYVPEWYVGQAKYSPYHASFGYGSRKFKICTECCPTDLAVVDYLTELREQNAESFSKSLQAHQRKEKRKEKEALTIVDGKKYSFTFKEVEEK